MQNKNLGGKEELSDRNTVDAEYEYGTVCNNEAEMKGLAESRYSERKRRPPDQLAIDALTKTCIKVEP